MKKQLILAALVSMTLIVTACSTQTETSAVVTPALEAPTASPSVTTPPASEVPSEKAATAKVSTKEAVKVDTKVPAAKTSTEVKTATEVKAPAPAVKKFSITAKKWEFSPSTITVNKGDTVELSIKSTDVTHGFFLSAFNVSKNLAPGETVTASFVADKTGSFSFICSTFCGTGHATMTGTLVVK